MRSALIKATAALFVCLLTAAAPLLALAGSDWQTAYSGVLSHLGSSTPSFGSINGEWRVFALARSGRISPESAYCAEYYSVIEDHVSGVGSGTLNPQKATENSRVVIALTSIGRDARSVAGYDLVEPITDVSFVKRQGPTGAAFALLALDSSASYGASAAKEALVDFLLRTELSGGGWSLGTDPDPDATAIAVTALSPYARAASAVSRGIGMLSSLQRGDGLFETVGNPTCESSAQVVTALSTVGIDADTDERFIKNGVSALSGLCSYYNGSGFAHSPGGSTNEMASEQAAYSLAAYYRYKHGRSDLFDMNDVTPYSPSQPEPTSVPTAAPTQTPAPTAAPTPKPTPAPTDAPAPSETPAPTDAPAPSATEPAASSPAETPEASPASSPAAAETDNAEANPASSGQAGETVRPQTEDTANDDGVTEASANGRAKKGRPIVWAAMFAGAAAVCAAFAIVRRKAKK